MLRIVIVVVGDKKPLPCRGSLYIKVCELFAMLLNIGYRSFAGNINVEVINAVFRRSELNFFENGLRVENYRITAKFINTRLILVAEVGAGSPVGICKLKLVRSSVNIEFC